MPDHQVRLIWNRSTNVVTVEHSITKSNLKENDTISFRAFEELTPKVTFRNGSPFSADDTPIVINDSSSRKVVRASKKDHPGQFDCVVLDAKNAPDPSTQISQGGNVPHPGGK